MKDVQAPLGVRAEDIPVFAFWPGTRGGLACHWGRGLGGRELFIEVFTESIQLYAEGCKASCCLSLRCDIVDGSDV